MSRLVLWIARAVAALVLAVLAACASAPGRAPVVLPGGQPAPATTPESPGVELPADTGALTATRMSGKSRWVAVPWSDLPGFEEDALFEAWNALLKSCERPAPVFVRLCPDIRRLSIADATAQRVWLRAQLDVYRVEPLGSPGTPGLLTAYYEPEFDAKRLPDARFTVPLFQPPIGLKAGTPWYSRQAIDTQAQAQASLRGREIAYLSDPVQALVMQIQGSGRVRLTEPDGSVRLVRLAYAGNNGQPYQSIGRWLIDQGELRDASWPSIQAWMAQNPQRQNELLWKNPRVVFFREEPLNDFDAGFGPRGAQGVPLTPGRSIAVDPDSIPYGTPVWLASSGATLNLQRLVVAQDTGSAITGAVRADYFVGWGASAGELAGRLKQPLQLWVLWPKGAR